MVEKDLKGKKENAGNLDMRAEILKEGGGVWAFGGAQEQLILLAPLVPQKSYSSDVVGKMSSLTGSPLQSYLWEKTAFIP